MYEASTLMTAAADPRYSDVVAAKPRLHSLSDRVANANARALEILSASAIELDRIFGPRPENNGVPKEQPCRIGELGNIEDGVASLDNTLVAISDQIMRLRGL